MKSGDSKIGLGTGTLASVGKGTSAKTVDAIVGAARDLGVKVIDTADSYTSGCCESLLGAALAGRRDDFAIITKAGYRHGTLPAPLEAANPYLKRVYRMIGKPQCFSPGYLAKCLDRSLARLRTDRVEAFLLHDPPPDILTDSKLHETLEGFRRAGKVIDIGVATLRADVIQGLADAPSFKILECPLSLWVDPTLRQFWASAHAASLKLIANNVFFSGSMPKSGRLPEIARNLGIPLHELLMRFAASRSGIQTILAGTRNPDHLAESVKWAASPLTPETSDWVAAAFAG